jgi:hypothetical protein
VERKLQKEKGKKKLWLEVKVQRKSCVVCCCSADQRKIKGFSFYGALMHRVHLPLDGGYGNNTISTIKVKLCNLPFLKVSSDSPLPVERLVNGPEIFFFCGNGFLASAEIRKERES